MPKLDPPKAEKVGHDTIWRSKPVFSKVGGKELSVKELNGLEKQEVEVKSIIVQSFLNQKVKKETAAAAGTQQQEDNNLGSEPVETMKEGKIKKTVPASNNI